MSHQHAAGIVRFTNMLPSMLIATSLVLAGSSAAQPSQPASSAGERGETPIFTRARVTSITQEDGDKLYIRLKLLPRSKIPFTTQTFRVVDRSLLSGIQDGAWVKFTSRHMNGENTLTSIHVVAECKRFQHCD